MTLDAVREVCSRRDVRLVAKVWLTSRLLVVIAAVVVLVTRPDVSLRSLLTNWDVAHFIEISQNGYAKPNSQAFFPGLPILLRFTSELGFDVVVMGIVLSLIGSALAAGALYKLGGPAAAIAWLIAPTAVFTVVGYTESLFCAAAFWAWERAQQRRYLAMALLVGAACTIRVSGLFLAGALGILILTQAENTLIRRIVRLGWLIIPFGVIFAYMAFLYTLTGDWLAWYHAEATGWARSITNPLQAFINTVNASQPGAYPDHPEWKWIFRLELVSVFVGLLTTAIALRRRQLADAGYVAVQVLAFSLSFWFQSVCRAVLLWFPTWIFIGHWAEKVPATPRARLVHTTAVAVAATLSCVALTAWAWLYFNGLWAS